MKIEKTVILETCDFDTLHDLIFEALDKSFSNEEIIKIWQDLPNHIKLDAEKYGISYNVVWDNIYEFLKKENNS